MSLWNDMSHIIDETPKDIDLNELKGISRAFFRGCYIKSGLQKDYAIRSLLGARVELEKMITIILHHLKRDSLNLFDFGKDSNEEINKKIFDIIHNKFSSNFSAFEKRLDEEQDTQFVKVDEDRLTFSRIIAFKGYLETCFFDVIYMPLKMATETYKVEKDTKEFCYNWFTGVSSVLTVKAGERREKHKREAIFRGDKPIPYSDIQDFTKTKPAEEGEKKGEKSPIDEEWDELFGEDTE